MKNRNYDSLAVARRIRAAGRPIYIAEDDAAAPSILCDALLVHQTGGLMESRAIDCSNCTAFIHLSAHYAEAAGVCNFCLRPGAALED